MEIFSFHLAKTRPERTLRAMCAPGALRRVPGLQHVESLAAMRLGAPIVSPARLQLTNVALFAAWESEAALDAFLGDGGLGRDLAAGWQVRMRLMRRWGSYPGLDRFPADDRDADPELPVVAVTLARLKLPELPRFTRWGKPVEEQVRDHPGTTLALAAFRPPRTFSTFSVWRTQREMTDMVGGRCPGAKAKRHAEAMVERERRDFHHAFTTLRFRALSERGEWKGKGGFVPGGPSR